MSKKRAINPLYFIKPGEEIEPLYFTKPGEVINPLFWVEENTNSQDNQEESADVKPQSIAGWQNTEPITLKKNSDEKQTAEEKMTLSMVLSKAYDVANFIVKPLCRKVYMDRNGDEVPEREEIDCVVFINQISHKMTLRTSEISSICKIITKRFADAIIDYEKSEAKKIIELQFRQDVRFCEHKIVYMQGGWQIIENRKTYVRDGIELGAGIEVETGMTLPAYPWNAELIMQVFQNACSLYRNMTSMYTMLAFSLMGVLYRPFREAGFVPRFTLFLNGKTGSLKTSIGKILYMQLCEEEFRDNPRRIDSDTAASLERAIVASGYDTITLIDDFSPAKTEMKRREMQDKLEMIIRMVGDGSSRSRSSLKLEDRRGEGVQGMVILTGELMGKGVSSNLRCLYCKMEREYVNMGNVTWFQENPHAFTTFIAAFADFIGQNYEVIKKHIAGNFNLERKNVSAVLKERRLIDSAVTLRIACDVLRNFLVIVGEMEDKKADEIVNMMKAEIVNCAVISEALSTEESLSLTFVRAIASLMRINQIVVNTEKVATSDATQYDGFSDKEFYYFNPDIVHKKVVAFLRQTNRYFTLDLNEILTMLAEDKIIKTAPNGAGKRTFCVRIPVGNGVRHNFLKIRKSIFEAVIEGNYDYEKGEKEEQR